MRLEMSDSQVVLDASALLALINEEKGSEKVAEALPNAMMSAVNLSEVATVLMGIGMKQNMVEEMTVSLIDQCEAFTDKQAYVAASLRKTTKKFAYTI